MVEPVVRRASVLTALALAAATACGGISERHVDDDDGAGSGGDDASGGKGGRGGVGADGGSFTTGGSDDGGSTFTGGTGAVGGSFTGGTGADGGSFTTGGSFTGGSSTGGNGAMGGNFTTGGAGGSVSTGGTVPVAGSPSGGAPSDPYAIPWQFNGYIAPETNIFGIQGGLYFSTDCESTREAGLPCTIGDPSRVGPDGQYGWAVSEVVACASGTAPQVGINPTTGVPAYELQWGALLGIAMNQAGSSVFDARTHGIAGFTFDISATAPAQLRVNVVTPATFGSSHFITINPQVSPQKVLFAEALQGSWVTNPVPLDTSQLSSIELHVFTNAGGPQPFQFCILNLRVIPG